MTWIHVQNEMNVQNELNVQKGLNVLVQNEVNVKNKMHKRNSCTKWPKNLQNELNAEINNLNWKLRNYCKYVSEGQ